MEPILIRVGEIRGREGHHETEVMNNAFGFLPLKKKKKKSKGSPVSDLETEAYFLINDNVTQESLFRK